MRPLTTLILLALAAAAVGFIVFFEHKQPSSRERAESSRYVLQIDPAEVTGVEITNAAGKVMLSRETGGAWRVTSPVKDRADAAGLGPVLELASAAEVDQRIPGKEADKKSELRSYGLDKGNAVRVVFTLAGGKKHALLVGKDAAYAGTSYIRVEGEEDADVLVARTPARPVLARAPGEWRDPRLVSVVAENVQRISVRGAAGEVQVERRLLDAAALKRGERALWTLSKPVPSRAEQEMVTDRLVPGLVEAKVTSFAESLPATAAQPAVQVTLWSPTTPAEGEVLEIFPDDEGNGAWARSSLRPGVAHTTADLLDLKALRFSDLRDFHLAALEPKNITTLLVRPKGAPEIPVYRVRNQWYVAQGKLVHEANRERVLRLAELLNKSEALDAIDQPGAPAEYGLDAPFLELVFGSATHPSRTQPAAPKPDDSLTLRLGEVRNRFFAQWSGQSTVWRFDGSILSEVATDWLKYKSTRLLSFPPMAIHTLTVAKDPSPPVELTFSLENNSAWTAKRLDADVTEHIDRMRLERLVSRLSELNANDWLLEPQPGLDALKSPVLRLTVSVDEFVDDQPEPKRATVTLEFAPTTAGQQTALYYGRLAGDENVFTIHRTLFEELATPVLVDKTAQNP